MSYDLFFYNKEDMSTEEVDEFVNNDDDKYAVQTGKKNKIIKTLKESNLEFEIAEIENGTELNFETYQVSIYKSEVVISLPYWNENQTARIGSEIDKICETLLNNGFTGYDPQSEMTFSYEFDFENLFSENLERVSPILKDFEAEEEKGSLREKIIKIIALIIVGLAIFGFIQLIRIIF